MTVRATKRGAERTSLDGTRVEWSTGPIVWGEPGTMHMQRFDNWAMHALAPDCARIDAGITVSHAGDQVHWRPSFPLRRGPLVFQRQQYRESEQTAQPVRVQRVLADHINQRRR